MNSCDLAYLAGFIDGEGSFAIQRGEHATYYAVTMRVSNTDKDVLEWIVSKFGGRLYSNSNQNGKQKQVWEIHWRSAEMRVLIPVLLPFLKTKRRRAEIVLKYLSHYSQRVTTQEHLNHRVALYQEISKLNRRGVEA